MKKNLLCKTRKRAGAIEPALKFVEKKTLMNRPDKSHPKSKTFDSTQTLVFHEERSGMQNKKTDGDTMTNESQ
jgi:hypothetical protein